MNTITWRAVYTDGSYLDAKDAAKGYADIDRTRLASFCLLKEEKVIFHLVLKPDQRLIWRKRTLLTPGAPERVFHLVGYQKTIKGENFQCIAYVDEDGTVIMAGEWEGDHILMGNVELLDFE
jgi:hypothetical protein